MRGLTRAVGLAALAMALHLAFAGVCAAQDGDARTAPSGTSARPAADVGLTAPRIDTGITGRVMDDATGEPMIEAFVSVDSGARRSRTDIDGTFAIDLLPGTHTVRIFFHLFDPIRIEQIVVRRGQVTRLRDVRLRSQRHAQSAPTQDAPVTARANTATAASLVQARRQSASVSDGVSAEDISRLPDTTAGDVIRRIPGVSLQGGQYAVVRGLGGRYVNVLLNGIPLPYTDPDVPAFQLDLLPAALLNSLNLVKTFTPDMPGDFAGGSLQISSREYPTRLTFTGSVSLGVDSLTQTAGTLRYRGGSLDWLGFDDGTRGLPGTLPSVRVQSNRNGLTRDDVTQIARGFPNIWNIGRVPAMPLTGLAFTLGNTVRVAGRPLGYLFSLSYNLAPRRLLDLLRPPRRGDGGVLEPREEIWREYSNTSVLLGALATFNFQPAPHHDLGLVLLWTQSSNDIASVRSGYDESIGTDVNRRVQQYVQRTMLFGQLFGDHRELPGHLRLRWQVFGAYGGRSEPDFRAVSYALSGERFAVVTGTDELSRLYSSLGQVDGGGAVDLAMALGPITPRVGALLRLLDRTFSLRRFTIDGAGLPFDIATSVPDIALAPERFGNGLELREFTRSDDSYRAIQQLVAPYARLDVNIADRVRLIGGARFEVFRQWLRPQPPVTDQDDTARRMANDRTDLNVLPSGSIVWAVTASMNLRAAYGGTVARPLVRELAPYVYYDFVRNRGVSGNPRLQSAFIHNVDVRWEWFPGAADVVSASLFYKHFINPIEPSFPDRDGNVISYQNAQGAVAIGAEFEGRMDLGRISPRLRGLSVGANLALIHSVVSLSPAQVMNATNPNRPLAGQSPFVANVMVGYAPPQSRFSAFLFYNVFGRRLEDVGTFDLPDIYEETFHQLDASVVWDPVRNLQLRFVVRNILNQGQNFVAGDNYVAQRSIPATTMTLRASFSF